MARPPAKVLRTSRFASRRREVRRAKQRRRRRVTITFLTLSLLGTGGWMMARSSLFALEGIEIAGTRLLTRADIVGASGLRQGDNMLSLDLEAVEARVAELPLVRSVAVTKPVPGRVRILVEERMPAYVLETIDGFHYLDAEAVVIGVAPGLQRALPTIRSLSHELRAAGERASTPDVVNAIGLLASLPDALKGGDLVVDVVAGGYSVLRSGLTIKFGSYDRIRDKIHAVRLVVDRARVARERLAMIDVRSPARPAALLS